MNCINVVLFPRNRLKGNWGIADVDDCANGAHYLASTGRADEERLIITGGSAGGVDSIRTHIRKEPSVCFSSVIFSFPGGFTTLAALAFRDVFKAGTSLFGVSDLEALTMETHKFESRYLDGLLGPYPERKDIYLARSPINHIDQFATPLLLLQGSLLDCIAPLHCNS